MYPEYLLPSLTSPRGQPMEPSCTLTGIFAAFLALSYSPSNPNPRLSFVGTLPNYVSHPPRYCGRVDGETSLDFAALQRVRRVIQRNHRHGLSSLGIAYCPPGGNPVTPLPMSRLGPPRSHSHSSAASATSSSLHSTIFLDSSRGPPTHRHDHSIPSGTSAWDRQLRRLSVTPPHGTASALGSGTQLASRQYYGLPAPWPPFLLHRPSTDTYLSRFVHHIEISPASLTFSLSILESPTVLTPSAPDQESSAAPCWPSALGFADISPAIHKTALNPISFTNRHPDFHSRVNLRSPATPRDCGLYASLAFRGLLANVRYRAFRGNEETSIMPTALIQSPYRSGQSPGLRHDLALPYNLPYLVGLRAPGSLVAHLRRSIGHKQAAAVVSCSVFLTIPPWRSKCGCQRERKVALTGLRTFEGR
ncbi:hypothetical protein BDP55DRAFT_625304 [Colletotrichum godetiae]|uniref:Uncharacterized protein n=1 Tax=Colletotrichum godetiae TaxID=1209918 RepID=A0AAJ0B241_9PEZI|nr:uncharacterized protein BDP55DRAFT_625304 [Colletotrichum godetiae]KAK1701050.1 hypothetical protein BDP55DRAFT_625304 [Colletotrichum godetiae]